MELGPSAAAQRQLRTILAAGTAAGLTDAQLLRRFADRRAARDEASRAAELAFAALVARHGPMVLGVCRRIVGDAHEAEDAFQATFLVLARRAGAVRVDDSLGRWLYGVSRRVARRARARLDRRRAREAVAAEEPTTDPAHDPLQQALRAELEAELGRLPSSYRDPLVLCYLEGLSHREAARRLRWPLGTVRSRLARGRERLRRRLVRLGLAPAAGLGAAPMAAEAAVPAALAEFTVRAAARLATGRAAAAGAVPEAAAALANEMMRAMTMTRLKLAAALLAAGIVATGAGVRAYQDGPRSVPADGGAAGKTADGPEDAVGKATDGPEDAAPKGAELYDAAPGAGPGAGGGAQEDFAAEVARFAQEAAHREHAGDVEGALDAIRRLEGRAREWDRALRLRRPDHAGSAMTPAGLQGMGTSAGGMGAGAGGSGHRQGGTMGAAPKMQPGRPNFGMSSQGGSSAQMRGLGRAAGTGQGAGIQRGQGGPADGETDQERRLREVERKLDELIRALKDQPQGDRPQGEKLRRQ